MTFSKHDHIFKFAIFQEAAGETIVEAVAEALNGTATKVPATPEGMMIAYGSLVLMALFPIFIGSYRSVKSHRDQQENLVKKRRRRNIATKKILKFYDKIV